LLCASMPGTVQPLNRPCSISLLFLDSVILVAFWTNPLQIWPCEKNLASGKRAHLLLPSMSSILSACTLLGRTCQLEGTSGHHPPTPPLGFSLTPSQFPGDVAERSTFSPLKLPAQPLSETRCHQGQ